MTTYADLYNCIDKQLHSVQEAKLTLSSSTANM